ncbi:uncharacterized protein LOC110881648 [Helianthus annuus]|uniref:uncharacterized protein LOC110881648 n=1 Tax=Helianthus annuus TaxID=4232 RepID=UPI001652D097|nr:uncharacterized protein LOC110881648 [Helianthus annuus]
MGRKPMRELVDGRKGNIAGTNFWRPIICYRGGSPDWLRGRQSLLVEWTAITFKEGTIYQVDEKYIIRGSDGSKTESSINENYNSFNVCDQSRRGKKKDWFEGSRHDLRFNLGSLDAMGLAHGGGRCGISVNTPPYYP